MKLFFTDLINAYFKEKPDNPQNINPDDFANFVFKLEHKTPEYIGPSEDSLISSPYKYFSLEIEKGFISVDQDNKDLWNIACIACIEQVPCEYNFLLLVVSKKQKYIGYIPYSTLLDEKHKEDYLSLKAMVEDLLSRVKTDSMGKITSSDFCRYKSNGIKKKYKPNNIIYVSHKLASEAKTKCGQYVKPMGSFFVRGHWRRINEKSFGLDRQGVRCIKGFTWIHDYKKGEGEAKRKVYKVC